MRKRHSFDRLFEGNMLVLFCVIFTVIIIVEVILATIRGSTVHLSVQSLIWHVIFISAPLLPLAIFQYLWRSNYIGERDYLFWVSIPLHYLISCGITLLYLFIRSFFVPLTQRIYLVVLINYSIMYIIILAGAVIIDLLQTAKANRNLRKIQLHRERTQ